MSKKLTISFSIGIFVLLLMLFSAFSIKADGVPDQIMYRVYNTHTGEHLYSKDRNEVNTLIRLGWRDEGIGWRAIGGGGLSVYRLYNPNLGDHLYTMDRNEVNVLVARGWRRDNNGEPVYFSNGSRPVYRLYNRSTGRHLLTRDLNEYNVLGNRGWVKEGRAMDCMAY